MFLHFCSNSSDWIMLLIFPFKSLIYFCSILLFSFWHIFSDAYWFIMMLYRACEETASKRICPEARGIYLFIWLGKTFPSTAAIWKIVPKPRTFFPPSILLGRHLKSMVLYLMWWLSPGLSVFPRTTDISWECLPELKQMSARHH